MKSAEFDRLDLKTKKIIANHSEHVPVPVGKMARALGINKILLTDSFWKAGSSISGQISAENHEYIIRIDSSDSKVRQRFTIAHELAHFLLHKEIIDGSRDGIKDDVLFRSGQPESIEFEANRLAADILMPYDLIKENLEPDSLTPANFFYTVEVLAARFQVSEAAMKIRLENLV